jgi:hypothetical protein
MILLSYNIIRVIFDIFLHFFWHFLGHFGAVLTSQLAALKTGVMSRFWQLSSQSIVTCDEHLIEKLQYGDRDVDS